MPHWQCVTTVTTVKDRRTTNFCVSASFTAAHIQVIHIQCRQAYTHTGTLNVHRMGGASVPEATVCPPPQAPSSLRHCWLRLLCFGVGGCLLTAGDVLHIDMWATAMDFETSGMGMNAVMISAMAMLAVGVALLLVALVPPRGPSLAACTLAAAGNPDRLVRLLSAGNEASNAALACLDDAPFSSAHARVCVTLTLGIIIDTMKPSSLAFVLPGLKATYGLTTLQASAFPTVALSGTAVGSLLWGAAADRWGRRPAVLAASVVFVATTACGAMPSFSWNLVMCAFMGLGAGGMLPVVFALLSELVPARHRGAAMVIVGGIGTAGGLAAAAGASAVLVPLTSWRVLWILNTPTGLALMLLVLGVPESPRFLVGAGRFEEAAAVLRSLLPPECLPIGDAGSGSDDVGEDRQVVALAASPVSSARRFTIPSLSLDSVATRSGVMNAPPDGATRCSWRYRSACSRHSLLTASLCAVSLSWGLVANGFSLWLPTALKAHGVSADTLLAYSSLIAGGAVPFAALGYKYWSSKGMLLAAGVGMWLCLVVFAAGGLQLTAAGAGASSGLLALLAALTVTSTVLTAVLSAYTVEVFSTRYRARGSGLISATGKLAGVAAPSLVAAAAGWEPLRGPAVVVGALLTLALLASARFTVETRGLDFSGVQAALSGKPALAAAVLGVGQQHDGEPASEGGGEGEETGRLVGPDVAEADDCRGAMVTVIPSALAGV